MSSYRTSRGVTPALRRTVADFVLLLAPFAPHMAEELWERLGGPYSVHDQPWPAGAVAATSPAEASPAGDATVGEDVTLVVQVDGRVRDRLALPPGAGEAEVRSLALASPAVQRALHGGTTDRTISRIIYVPGRLVNIVTTAPGS